jgi:uncharacterized membrane protein
LTLELTWPDFHANVGFVDCGRRAMRGTRRSNWWTGRSVSCVTISAGFTSPQTKHRDSMGPI